MRVLTVNPGSTSLKVALVEDGQAIESETLDGSDDLSTVAHDWPAYDAAGVRFVHGGPRHLTPVRLDDTVLRELDGVAELAPLHNPPASQAARALLAHDSQRPVVGCFDTTYHAELPAAAATYALPAEWNERWSLRRYGFHGLSHEHAARQAAVAARDSAGRDASHGVDLRVISCHLGGGASVCASLNGRSVDTSMGFTPMEGLVMATRSGSVDPGLLLHLLRHGVGVDELEEALDRNSGLAGLSGTSGDLRDVVAATKSGAPGAILALEVYLHRLVREVGGLVAVLGGLDVLVLTGGVGQHSEVVRERLTSALSFLEPPRVLQIEAREDLMIDEHTRAALDDAPSPNGRGAAWS